jgi:hypothetical protein
MFIQTNRTSVIGVIGLVIEGNRNWQMNLIYIIVEREHLFYVNDKFIAKSTKMPQVLIDLTFIKLNMALSLHL